MKVVKQLFIAADQTINVLIWIPGEGFGMADETISARAFRCFLQGLISDRLYRTIDLLLFFDPNHCYESWKSEIERNQLPNHYRSIS